MIKKDSSCGREPGNEKITQTPSKAPVLERLEKKLDALTAELENSNSKNMERNSRIYRFTGKCKSKLKVYSLYPM